MLAPKVWTEDRIELLKKLFDAGHSMSEMAAEIGGVSRNAVIGKLHRLGLERRGSLPRLSRTQREANRRGKFDRDNAARRVARAHRRTESKSACKTEDRCTPRNLALTDLQLDDCRYPFGDGPFTFCGHPRIAGSSYCGVHDALCTRSWMEKAA